MKLLVVPLLMLAFLSETNARLTKLWSYQEMFDLADLVAVAKPISTEDTSEKGKLPEGPAVDVVGVTTKLEIHLVMKGDKALKDLRLHHYRQQNPKEVLVNGPDFVSFNFKRPQNYLVFLKKASDGRYVPVAGQTDPAGFSIRKLEGQSY